MHQVIVPFALGNVAIVAVLAVLLECVYFWLTGTPAWVWIEIRLFVARAFGILLVCLAVAGVIYVVVFIVVLIAMTLHGASDLVKTTARLRRVAFVCGSATLLLSTVTTIVIRRFGGTSFVLLSSTFLVSYFLMLEASTIYFVRRITRNEKESLQLLKANENPCCND